MVMLSPLRNFWSLKSRSEDGTLLWDLEELDVVLSGVLGCAARILRQRRKQEVLCTNARTKITVTAITAAGRKVKVSKSKCTRGSETREEGMMYSQSMTTSTQQPGTECEKTLHNGVESSLSVDSLENSVYGMTSPRPALGAKT